MALDLFVYGTLMNDALVFELTGRRFRKESAVLSGYRRIVPDGGYPYIVPDADARVEGVLLRAVDGAALRALDRYEDEGRLYRRAPVVVTIAAGQHRAMAYLGIPESLTRS